MKKRMICIVLVLAMAVCMVPAVSAAEHTMADIIGHWAEDDINFVIDMGLFNGTSEVTFEPNGTMTRGMFVTVLGRYAGIDPADYQDWYLPELYRDVNPDAYYAPYINWATRFGITNGTGYQTFSPDMPITREQMAVFLVRFANSSGYIFEPIREDIPESFTDQDHIASFAVEAVDVMRQSGIINGRANADGTFFFDPRALAARSECAAVFHRIFDGMLLDADFIFVDPEEITISGHENALLERGDTLRLECEILPAESSNNTVLWISSDPSILSVDANGVVTCNGSGMADIYAYTCNGCYDSVTISADYYVGYAGESYESKCLNLFGEVVEEHRRPYGEDAPKSTYLDNMVRVSVQVWDYKDGIGSEKVTKTRSFDVHKNLEATVKLCFKEIYECEEQYPIRSIVTYWATSGKSEHNPGTAIDINPDENPYVDPEGNVLVGKGFDPENNPYSFPVDGEVQQIFEKYGFTRGIYWRSGFKDYMHFSFFGT